MKVGDFVIDCTPGGFVVFTGTRVYGYPGDGINGVIGALQRANTIDFIQVRHEEMAAFNGRGPRQVYRHCGTSVPPERAWRALEDVRISQMNV